jgi:hypothetical protein
MAIKNPKAPEQGRAIVSENVSQILQANARGTGTMLKDLRTEDLAAADPHQSYFVSLEDLADGKLLSAAKPVTWRYLLIEGNNAVAEAELNADEKAGTSLQFLAVHQSPFANETLVALRQAEQMEKVKKGDYELRYLKIPAVYFAAVWLHGASDDILIPLAPAPAGIKENQPQSENQIIKQLKPLVQKTKKFDEGFEKGQGKPPKN